MTESRERARERENVCVYVDGMDNVIVKVFL